MFYLILFVRVEALIFTLAFIIFLVGQFAFFLADKKANSEMGEKKKQQKRIWYGNVNPVTCLKFSVIIVGVSLAMGFIVDIAPVLFGDIAAILWSYLLKLLYWAILAFFAVAILLAITGYTDEPVKNAEEAKGA